MIKKRTHKKQFAFFAILVSLVTLVALVSPFASAFSKEDVDVSFIKDANYLDIGAFGLNDDFAIIQYDVTADNATGNLSFTTKTNGVPSPYAQVVFLPFTLPIKANTAITLSWVPLFGAPYSNVVQIYDFTSSTYGQFITNGEPFTLPYDTQGLWLAFYPFNSNVSFNAGVTHTYSEMRLNIGDAKPFSSNNNLTLYLDYITSLYNTAYDNGYNDGYDMGIRDALEYKLPNVFDQRYVTKDAIYYDDEDGNFSVFDLNGYLYNQFEWIYGVRSADLPIWLLPDNSTYIGYEYTFTYDEPIPQELFQLSINSEKPVNVDLWFTFSNGETLRKAYSITSDNGTIEYSLSTENLSSYGDVSVFGFGILNRITRTTGYNETSILQSDAQFYNQGYETGYDKGYINGKNDATTDLNEQALWQARNEGEKEGYENGYIDGKSDGYGKGYNEGYELGAGGTDFNAVFLSAVQAPITALTGLLNFEIFGVNMTSFVYAIFTLCLVVTIIKLAI